MNSPIVQILSQNQTLHRTKVMAIFVIFWPILAKIWLPWQRPLDPFNQKCLLWIGRPLKPYLKPKILSIAVTQVKLCRFEGSRQV